MAMHTRRFERSARIFERHVTLLAILLAAFGFRIYEISNQSLWFDELATVSGVMYSHLNLAVIEPRSWLYVLVVSPFVALIPNEIGARWVSICAGVIATALIYRAGRALHSERAGLVAAALFTVSPQMVIYGQEARAYSLITALSLAILWMMALLDRGRRVGWVLLILIPITVAAHLLALPVIAVIVGIAALRKLITGRGASWGVLGASLAVMLIPAAVILGVEQARAASSGGLSWVDWITSSPPLVDLASFMINALGLPPAGWLFDALIGYALLGIILIWVRRASESRHAFAPHSWNLALVGGMALIPPLIISLSALVGLQLWLLRYLLPSMAAFILLVGMALANARPRMLGAVIMAAILGVSAILTQKYYTLPIFWREDWRGSVGHIAANVGDGDLVVACSTFYEGAIQFYQGEAEFEIIYLPAGEPDAIPQRVIDHAESGTVWMLNRADDCARYGDWPALPALEPHQVEKTVFQGLTVYQYGK